jgi:hypothetical protein
VAQRDLISQIDKPFPVIEGTKTTYWRYPLRKYDFTERRGVEKWTAYTFRKDVYDMWKPTHFKRICSTIDDLPPKQDFDLSHRLEPQISEGGGTRQSVSQATLTYNKSRQRSAQPGKPASKKKKKKKKKKKG